MSGLPLIHQLNVKCALCIKCLKLHKRLIEQASILSCVHTCGLQRRCVLGAGVGGCERLWCVRFGVGVVFVCLDVLSTRLRRSAWGDLDCFVPEGCLDAFPLRGLVYAVRCRPFSLPLQLDSRNHKHIAGQCRTGAEVPIRRPNTEISVEEGIPEPCACL